MLPRWFVPQCPVLCVQNSPHSPSQCLLHFLSARECFSLHIYHPPLFMSVRSAFPVFVTDSVTQLGCVYFLPDQKCSFSHDCWSLFDLTSTQGEKNGTSQVYECEKTTQEPSHPAPPHQPTMPTKPTYAPTENTSCSSTCPTQPLPSVTICRHIPDPEHLSDLKHLVLQNWASTTTPAKRPKAEFKAKIHPIPNILDRFFQKNLPDLLVQDIPWWTEPCYKIVL